MCKGTWACFECRLAIRHQTWRGVAAFYPWLIGSTGSGTVRCSNCHKACTFLGPALEIPPKHDVKGWKRLRERVWKICHAATEKYFEDMVRWRHKLEQKIEHLKSQPANPGR